MVYALVITWFGVQYDQYFPSFSDITDLFYHLLGEWNNSKIWETEINIGHVVQGKHVITAWLLTLNMSDIR